MSFNPLLVSASDSELADNLKNNKEIDASLEILTKRHSGVFIKVAAGFKSNPYVDFNILIQEKPWTIWQCALRFDQTKGKFDTMLGNEVKNVCLRMFEDNNWKKFDQIDPQYYILDKDNVRQNVEYGEKIGIIDEEVSKTDLKSQNVFNERYYESDDITRPQKWNKIGEKNGITKCGAWTKDKNLQKKLKERLSLI